MLISFKVSNYTSFKDEAELSMLAAKSEMNSNQVSEVSDLRILRASAIYGANASGKSNLIKAISAIKRLVVFNTPLPSDRFFRPDPVMKDKPSSFQVEIEIDGKMYTYGFEYLISKQEVTEEWLYRMNPDGTCDIIFTRIGKVIKHLFSGPDKQKLDVYAEDTVQHPQRLFINVMGRRARPTEGGLAVFNDVYDWFDRGLVMIDTDFPFSPEVAVSDEDLENLNKIISSFGTGVNHVVYERKAGLAESFPQSLLERLRSDLGTYQNPATVNVKDARYASVGGYRASLVDGEIVLDEILYRHNGDITSYRPDEESAGTRKLYGLLVSIFLGGGGPTFIIDELDMNLHPQLTYRFVKLFLDYEKMSRSQIVFSTHESSLLDFDLLRRDEIWFVEKDKDGRSRLYSLEEFNERYDRRIEKAYREGRYGGVPVFSSIYPPWSDE